MKEFNRFCEDKKEVLLYLIFGGLSFFLSCSAFDFFCTVLCLNELLANAYSWMITVLFVFLTNRKWVFQIEKQDAKHFFLQLFSFYGGRVITLGIEEILLFITVSLAHFPVRLMKISTQIIVIVLNYIISKLFVFKRL